MVAVGGMAKLGSSPLARGAQNIPCRREAGSGLIPARAGSTARGCGTTPAGGAHPRSRGEHWQLECIFGLDGGSSPLARGARYGAGTNPLPPGLIPARAGSTVQALHAIP